MTLNMLRSAEVAAALAAGRAVVALESTIITHGMPYPQNLEMARGVEQLIREAGAVPATVAVIDGVLHIGLEDATLEKLAQTPDAAKLSRADMALCLSRGGTGATTVAATMIGARLAGIDVFATGGIGGVHRGAEQSFDISADLQELAQTAITVVAAGAKAILDIPKTLEMLETLGVPVIVFGQDKLPAFWSRESEHPAPQRLDTASDIARSHLLRSEMKIPGGQLVANPVPNEAEIPQAEIEPIIQTAIKEATDQAVAAKSVTPFLLQRIFELTEGRSLVTNIALVRNNAKLAAEIAVALSELKKSS